MKTIYGTILVLTMASAILLATPLPCRAAENAQGDFWSDDDRAKAEGRRFRREGMGRMEQEGGRRFGRGRPNDIRRPRPGGPGGPRKGIGPGGPHRGAGGPGAGPRRDMIKERMRERHEEYLEWLKKNYPEEAKKLDELRKKSPQLYMRKIMLSLKTYGLIAKASKENPALAEVLKEDLELKKERYKLLRKIRAADDDKKKELTEKLQKVINSRFDLIVRRKQTEYKHLQKKLERLKKEVKEREAEVEKWQDVKSEKVKERVKELLSRTEKFNWD